MHRCDPSHVAVAATSGRVDRLVFLLLAVIPASSLATEAGPPLTESLVSEARIETLDRFQTEQRRLQRLMASTPPPYEDRYADEKSTDGADEDRRDEGRDLSPGLRSWLVESRMGFGRSSGSAGGTGTSGTGFGARSASEIGLRTEYRSETRNAGDYVLQADLRQRSGDSSATLYGLTSVGTARSGEGGRFSLRNIGFPIDAHTFADTTVGDLYSELTDGIGRNYRLTLGSATVRGISTRVFGADFDLRAGVGERGRLTGGPYPGFEKDRGTLGWLGFTRRFDSGVFVAAQIDRAIGVSAYDVGLYEPQGIGAKDVTSWAAATGYAFKLPAWAGGGSTTLRATLLGSRTNSATPIAPVGDARGLLVEGSVRSGRLRQEFGAYAADPNLQFGADALALGTRGAYWRIDHSISRLSWGAGVEQETGAPVAGYSTTGYRRIGANGNFQWQLDRRSSVGGSANIYGTRYDRGDGDGQPGSAIDWAAPAGRARSMYASVYAQTRFFELPRSRLALTLRRNELVVLGAVAATGQELQWEQDWTDSSFDSVRPEVTTTVGYAQDQSSGATRRYPTAGVQLRQALVGGFSVAGNLRYTSQSSNLDTSRGLSGQLFAEREMAAGWRLGVSVQLNQARSSGRRTSLFSPQVYRSDDRSVFVYLRWEGNAGSAYQTAGIRTSAAGAGRVVGRVFLDANRDAEAQVDELGAAGVEVLLDGRYRTLTERDGRFEFPFVATGRHRLSVTPDTVPLPWSASTSAGTNTDVDVPLRGQATLDIPLTRVAE